MLNFRLNGVKQVYLIGIDIGTSSSKGVLVNEQGNVLAAGKRTHDVEFCHPGWAEQDADQVWWKETRELIRELLVVSKVPADEIAAIGCSGVCPVIVPIDREGRPLRKAILYSIDARSTEQIHKLNARFGPDWIKQSSGQSLSYQSVMPKLMWLQENEPQVWQHTYSVLSASGYLVFRLCGAAVMDHFTAADGGFGYAPSSLSWSEEDFAEAGIDVKKMPQLGWATDIAGTVSPEAALETGLLRGTPVIIGTGDALSEMISTGVAGPGEASLLYGSTLSLMTMVERASANPTVPSYPGWKEGQLIVAAGVRSGMSSFSWLRRLLGDKSEEELFRRAQPGMENVPVGADGLLVLPYLSGETSGYVDSKMKGAFLGLSLHHDLGHLMRAMIEGIGFALRHSMQRIPGISAVRVVGGGAKNRFLLQVISDICNCEQLIVSGHVGGPLGSAWLAGAGAGLLKESSSGDWVEIADCIIPNEAHSAEYDRIYEQFKQSLG